jgi:dephospho-CoA kinase
MTKGPMPLVIGITGPNAAGKGEVAAYLATLGFRVHSLSDVVREESLRLGFPPEREHLIRIGNDLRRAFGPAVLAERILPRLGGRDVVDSIRHPAEVEALRRLPGFVLVGVTARTATRFARSVARGRPGDPASLEAFAAREVQENSAAREGQQLDATFRLADRAITNDDDLEALHDAVGRLVGEFGGRGGLEGQRPGPN